MNVESRSADRPPDQSPDRAPDRTPDRATDPTPADRRPDRASSHDARTAEPASPVAYLDMVLAEDTAQAYKRVMLELLQPRAGDCVLDIGCGTGDDARAVARLVAPGGRVIGLDTDVRMLAEAWRRSAPLRLPLEFRVGRAERLEFEDGTFSACRSDRVWQHVPNPDRALAEVVRVSRPRARIVIADVDWDLLAINIEPRGVTRRIVAHLCDTRAAQGWMGRQLHGRFRQAGLTDVAVWPSTFATSDRVTADRLWKLRSAAEAAHAAAVIDDHELAAWTDALDRPNPTFFAAITGFIVRGITP